VTDVVGAAEGSAARVTDVVGAAQGSAARVTDVVGAAEGSAARATDAVGAAATAAGAARVVGDVAAPQTIATVQRVAAPPVVETAARSVERVVAPAKVAASVETVSPAARPVTSAARSEKRSVAGAQASGGRPVRVAARRVAPGEAAAPAVSAEVGGMDRVRRAVGGAIPLPPAAAAGRSAAGASEIAATWSPALSGAFAPRAAAHPPLDGFSPRNASGIHRSAQPPARPAAPGGSSPASAGGVGGGVAGSAFGGAWAILLLELGLAGFALSVFLVAGGGRRPSSLVSLLERPG
jgi:hypothetical protein